MEHWYYPTTTALFYIDKDTCHKRHNYHRHFNCTIIRILFRWWFLFSYLLSFPFTFDSNSCFYSLLGNVLRYMFCIRCFLFLHVTQKKRVIWSYALYTCPTTYKRYGILRKKRRFAKSSGFFTYKNLTQPLLGNQIFLFYFFYLAVFLWGCQ